MTVKVAFSDFTPSFSAADCLFVTALNAIEPVRVVEACEADLLFYSDFGEQHWAFKGLKVYVTGENMLPDFDQCDLAFTPHSIPEDWRAVRLPYYAQVVRGMGRLVRGVEHSVDMDRPRFCSFVVSNPRGPERNAFFKSLNRLRPVDSAGRHFNNMGGPVSDKMALLRECRFNLAFENSSSPGYITEKLVEPLLAGCIPIYWGAPDVAREFNPGCMINIADFPDTESAIDHILRVDADPKARLKLLTTPPFRDNREPECLSDSYVAAPLLRLLDSGVAPGPRHYRTRRLREHVYRSPLSQRLVSLRCRIDGLLWRLGLR